MLATSMPAKRRDEGHREVRLLVVDSRRGRLLRASRDAHGRTRISEEAKLELAWVDSQRGRPSALSQRGGYVYASPHKEEAEKDAAFARQVVAFLQDKLAQAAHDRVEVFAPARFLGTLRKIVPQPLRAQLQEHEGELVNFDASRLAAHPQIAKLLGES